ncbi:iron-siderophore ABC transporter substrate-binding protein [Xylanibacillus composti]|uniref:Putative siderophore-binding lipoprotein YfiY n=1 Tax=Xylanibacillus composti TaxID=1572762 RepID=A0A8J4H1S3_9BACL|nr:iron-siderophore ABC transporter substrate-binding protein [Xylanibacillus composti]MDT9723961.1 iron-siderophore ABC transporter substrate-binding protein [Xylanibacillus composti]GIQ67842.1 putative siderophore-binding lipoprotein YfiY [Xylanibacillus composti]
MGKKGILLVMLLSLALALAACGGGSNQQPDASQAGSEEGSANGHTEDEHEAGDSEAAVGRTVAHAMGEAIVPEQAERVVVLDNGALDNVLALGVKPVGAPTVFLDDPFPAYLVDQTEGIRNIGSIDEPNLEVIAELRPDVILGSKDTHEAIYDKLDQIAPTVFVETLGYTWKENLYLQAEAIGKMQEAADVLQAYGERLLEFRERMGDRLTETEVSILRPRSDHIRIYLKQSFSGTIVEDAGLPRPPAQDKAEFAAQVSEEQVEDLAGDVIFWFSRDTDNILKTKLMNNPIWQQLEAVQAGKVIEVDTETWLSGLGVQAANRIVDDLFAHLVEE